MGGKTGRPDRGRNAEPFESEEINWEDMEVEFVDEAEQARTDSDSFKAGSRNTLQGEEGSYEPESSSSLDSMKESHEGNEGTAAGGARSARGAEDPGFSGNAGSAAGGARSGRGAEASGSSENAAAVGAVAAGAAAAGTVMAGNKGDGELKSRESNQTATGNAVAVTGNTALSEVKKEKVRRPIPGVRFLKRRWKRLLFLAILAYVIYVGIRVYGIMNRASEKSSASTQTFGTVSQMDISNSIAVTGTIVSNESRNVTTLVSKKKVIDVDVEVGDYVNKGDLICTFDTTDTNEKIEKIKRQMTVNSAKAEFNLYKANLELAWAIEDAAREVEEQQLDETAAIRSYNEQEITVGYREQDLADAIQDLEDAEDDYDEAKEELSWASPTDSDYSSLKSAKESAKKAVENAEDAVETARRNVQSAKNSLQDQVDSYYKTINSSQDSNTKNNRSISENMNSIRELEISQQTLNEDEKEELEELYDELSDCTVTSPITGLVTSVSVEEGDAYEEKSSICVIQDDSGYKVSGTVDQYDIASMKEGLEVVIKTDATGDEEMHGTVTFVSPVPSSSTSSTTAGSSSGSSSSSSTAYPIEITIEERDDRVRIGMTAETSVLTESRTGVLAVPYDAIEEGADGTSYVNVAVDGSAGAENENNLAYTLSAGEGKVAYIQGFSGQISRGRRGSVSGNGPGSVSGNRTGKGLGSRERGGQKGELAGTSNGRPGTGSLQNDASGGAGPTEPALGEADSNGRAEGKLTENPDGSASGGADGSDVQSAGQQAAASKTAGSSSSEKSVFAIILDVILGRDTETEEDEGSNEIQTRKVQVTTGLETDYYTEITSGDLKAGDQVLIPNSITTKSDDSSDSDSFNMGGPGGGGNRGGSGGPGGGGPGGGGPGGF
ncbi:MAG: efflux RND transporter periplasmic adaptor subunit [Lachnospiraceae bacterium]|nr:efflux RND transporter periplasmic adaptor subunit [Lachnospiraceae bacterium]